MSGRDQANLGQALDSATEQNEVEYVSSLVQEDPHEDKQDRMRGQRMVILDILSMGGNGNGQGKTFDQCLQ